MFFLALSPIQVALLSQYPRLPLHSNMLLTTCPFYPLWICTHCRAYLKQSKHRIIKGKQERAETSTSALITPHIHFPYRDLEDLLHTLDCSHHPCLRGPRITAHLPDQAQTTDGFRRDACWDTQVGNSQTLARKPWPLCAAPALLPLHSEPAQAAKALHLWVSERAQSNHNI